MNLRTAETIRLDDLVANVDVGYGREGPQRDSRELGESSKSEFEMDHQRARCPRGGTDVES